MKISEDKAQKLFSAIDFLRTELDEAIDTIIPAEAPFIHAGEAILFQLIAVLRSTTDEDYQRTHMSEQIRKNWQDALDAKYRPSNGESGTQSNG